MAEPGSWHFGPFHLDGRAARLWRGTEAVRLTAKALGVLHYLVAHADQLVTKDDLFTAVWDGAYVSDAALYVCIRELRQRLGDVAQTPQYVEAVRGRGYRFVAPVTSAAAALQAGGGAPRPAGAVPRPVLGVGREAELHVLQQCWVQAQQGVRQLVMVTGEAGMGKTTLVDRFVAQVIAMETLWLARGQCIEQHGAGEAYLPLLEALGRLGRGPHGTTLVRVLQQYAPSWLVHLPALVAPDVYESLQRRAGATTRERMLRELAEAVEVLTAERPLVLVLEDLHWSDGATLDWLASVARRREAARLLVLGTYRPVDPLVQEHRVHTVAQDLWLHGQATEVPMRPWSPPEVARYLTQRFGVPVLPSGLVDVLHQRTDGNPLFLVTVLDALVQQGVLRQTLEGWALEGGLEAAGQGIPESLRQLIAQQFLQLSLADQAVLEVASVAGAEFSAAVLTPSLNDTVEAVEARCEALARRGQFLRPCGHDEWPDGTVAARYGFLHALYQEMLYAQVPVHRQLRWHQQIGMRLEMAYSPRAREVAAELAEHFRRGRDVRRAVQYFQYAGENAQRRRAHQEAIGHWTTALALLTTLPPSPERDTHELALRTPLGTAWLALKGWPAPEVWSSLHPALALAQSLGRREALLPIYYGLASNVLTQGRIVDSLTWGNAMLAASDAADDADLGLVAHRVACMIHFWRGDFTQACRHSDTVMALYNEEQHYHLADLVHSDPKSVVGIYGSLATWMLGYPERAVQMNEASTAHARRRGHPFDLGSALTLGGLLWEHRGEPAPMVARAVEAEQLGRAYSLPFISDVLAQVLQGGAWLRAGRLADGIARLRGALTTYTAYGNEVAMPYFRARLAEGLALSGDNAGGLRLIEESLSQIARPGWEERCYLAEILRLKGWMLARQGDLDGAQQHYLAALDWARQQQAKSWELRTATSLARLWHSQGRSIAAHALLSAVYNWFTEGFDTTDLTAAHALLQELAGV